MFRVPDIMTGYLGQIRIRKRSDTEVPFHLAFSGTVEKVRFFSGS